MSAIIGTNHSKLRKCLYLYLGETAGCGLGLFTARAVKAGQRIIVDDDGDYFDKTFSYAELCSNGFNLHDDAVQTGDDEFVVPNNNLDDFMNHSCEPSCGVCFTRDGYYVVTLRDLERDEQISYDYSTQMSFDHPALPCHCGSTSCRGNIGNFDSLPAALQDHYIELGIVADFAIAAAMARRRHR